MCSWPTLTIRRAGRASTNAFIAYLAGHFSPVAAARAAHACLLAVLIPGRVADVAAAVKRATLGTRLASLDIIRTFRTPGRFLGVLIQVRIQRIFAATRCRAGI